MTCASCQHWHKVGLAHSSTTNKQGMCWRYPPSVAVVEMAPRGEQIRTIWPETQENEVCGEYKENAKPQLDTLWLERVNEGRKRDGMPPMNAAPKPIGNKHKAKNTAILGCVYLFVFVTAWSGFIIIVAKGFSK